ncbi:MAG: hypothetical protein OEW00_08260, partial [candidate division Zixibacteria bacterium]|nr:hypothetical protein [candidate division Zixibacteria bacterium]
AVAVKWDRFEAAATAFSPDACGVGLLGAVTRCLYQRKSLEDNILRMVKVVKSIMGWADPCNK